MNYTLDEYTRVIETLRARLKKPVEGKFDLYTEVAREAYGVEEVSKELRDRVKTICFGEMYSGAHLNSSREGRPE